MGRSKRTHDLISQGMYDEAIATIKEQAALNPRDPRPYMELADVYRAQRRLGPAIEAMTEAARLDPRNRAVHELLLRTLLETGRYDEAIHHSQRLIQRSPRDVFARDILGIAYLQQGMLDNALKVTDELIRLDPTDPRHHFKKAVLLQQKGLVGPAMDAFCKCLQMDPEGEMADDAREAIAALDSYQLRQVLTIAVDDTVFRAKLILDAESALAERGFHLSSSGLTTLRQLNLDEMPHGPYSRFYH